jgi:hypothetical protein
MNIATNPPVPNGKLEPRECLTRVDLAAARGRCGTYSGTLTISAGWARLTCRK